MNLILDRISSVPLYAQIHGEIRRQIETDELQVGAAVPSERELAEICKVSRMTARQALNALKKEGFVYQERGIGTFVSKRKLDVHTRNLIGFTEEMRGRGLTPSTKILLSRSENAAQEIAQELGIETEDEVFHFQRLRLADNLPLAFEDAFLPVKRFPDLDGKNLEKESLYKILEANYGIVMHHAEEVLEATCASKEIAAVLKIKPKSALLIVHRVVFTESNLAVESVRTFYRADRYRATFVLTKNAL
ncbi:MAG: GntR family transcriptional regulator [Acidobacteriota bacterium]|nr:GntR family transcriptional regulator [Acidobacteriota bacterium]